ncbi:MAG: glycine-rich domain-containing protein-like [Minisyncoccia bacterium]
MNQLASTAQSFIKKTSGNPKVTLPAFDLSIVIERVARDHPDWSTERLTAAELEYRRYLALCKMEPKTALIPTLDADEVWHTHILHTIQYRGDCKSFFGYFLDHAPFNRHNEKFPVGYTAKLYFEVFGDEYNTSNMAECTNCNCTDGISAREKRIQ